MSWWNAKYKNDHGEYEITFASKDYEKTKVVEKVCQAIIVKRINTDNAAAVVERLIKDPESLRPKGEWEMVDEYCCHAKEFRCSACGGSAYYDHYTRCCDYDFCPNCGADMRGGTDG